MPSALRGRALAVYCFLCAVWGSTWLVIKIGLEYLPPLRFAGFRMAAACLLLAPFAFRRGTSRPTSRELKARRPATPQFATFATSSRRATCCRIATATT